MTSTAEAKRCVQETIEKLGGLDIVIANSVCSSFTKSQYCIIDRHSQATQGWTRFSEFGDLDALDESEWDRVRLRSPICPFG